MCQKVLLIHDDTEQAYNGLSHSFSTTRQKMVNKYIQKLGNICREKSRKKIICTNVFNILFGFFIAGKSRIAFVLEDPSALCYIFSLCLFFARFRSNFVSVYNFCNKYPLISKQFQPILVT